MYIYLPFVKRVVSSKVKELCVCSIDTRWKICRQQNVISLMVTNSVIMASWLSDASSVVCVQIKCPRTTTRTSDCNLYANLACSNLLHAYQRRSVTRIRGLCKL